MRTGIKNEQAVISRAGLGLEEYGLVVRPDAAVAHKILSEKQHFLADYGLSAPLKTSAQITVAQFSAREGMEETLIRWIQRICSQQQSFLVTLNNYSGIPPHTIYLRVLDHGPFQQLSQQLRAIDEFIRSSACPPATLPAKPYLSLAGKLPEAVYSKAMPDYSRRIFHESFMVHELLLIKKDLLTGSAKTVTVFRFLPTQIEMI